MLAYGSSQATRLFQLVIPSVLLNHWKLKHSYSWTLPYAPKLDLFDRVTGFLRVLHCFLHCGAFSHNLAVEDCLKPNQVSTTKQYGFPSIYLISPYSPLDSVALDSVVFPSQAVSTPFFSNGNHERIHNFFRRCILHDFRMLVSIILVKSPCYNER